MILQRAIKVCLVRASKTVHPKEVRPLRASKTIPRIRLRLEKLVRLQRKQLVQ